MKWQHPLLLDMNLQCSFESKPSWSTRDDTRITQLLLVVFDAGIHRTLTTLCIAEDMQRRSVAKKASHAADATDRESRASIE